MAMAINDGENDGDDKCKGDGDSYKRWRWRWQYSLFFRDSLISLSYIAIVYYSFAIVYYSFAIVYRYRSLSLTIQSRTSRGWPLHFRRR